MRFASLGSGSRGNALVIEQGKTRVLIDCGFGPRQMATRLAQLNLVPDDIHAVVLTHEHRDHVAGIGPCVRRYGWKVFLTHGTQSAVGMAAADICVIDSHTSFSLGDIEITPFLVPHDAREPVQFVFGDGVRRLGLLTDAGHVTPHIREVLSGCDALVLECNHDADLLANGSYPAMLKKRIAGRLGHLDNQAAAALLAGITRDRLQHVIAAHLSQENNTPDLARWALAGALDCGLDWIGIAGQETGFDWRQIR